MYALNLPDPSNLQVAASLSLVDLDAAFREYRKCAARTILLQALGEIFERQLGLDVVVLAFDGSSSTIKQAVISNRDAKAYEGHVASLGPDVPDPGQRLVDRAFNKAMAQVRKRLGTSNDTFQALSQSMGYQRVEFTRDNHRLMIDHLSKGGSLAAADVERINAQAQAQALETATAGIAPKPRALPRL